MVTKHDLLFGLFALRDGLLTRDRLVDAVRTASSDDAAPLAKLLAERAGIDGKTARRIEERRQKLLDDFEGDTDRAIESFRLYGDLIACIEDLPNESQLETHYPDAGTGTVEALPDTSEYTQIRELARGGMGRVHLVFDQQLRRDVVMKELALGGEPSSSEHPSPPSASRQSRFLQEARISAGLEHPTIVPVHEIGFKDDGTPYYTMRLIRGKTLAQAIRDCRGFRERLELLPHFVALCQGIAYGHSRNVIHRDIKPDNVMVGEFGETYIIDWGIAKKKQAFDPHASALEDTIGALSAGSDASKTAYGQAIGTPAYMPPEQAKGQLDEVDERSDVYGLGATLYEILTGKAPFSGGGIAEVIARVCLEDPPPVEALAPDVPPELTALCARAMARDPAQRFHDAAELSDEIERFQRGRLVRSYEYRLGDYVRWTWRAHRRPLVAAMVVLALFFAGGVGSYARIVTENRKTLAANALERDARATAERAQETSEQEEYRAKILLASHQIKQRRYDAANELLWSTPEHLRNWEWGYLLEQCNQDAITLAGHGGVVSDARFDPSGERVVTASHDGTATIWDATTGAPLRALGDGAAGLRRARFSPDGRFVVTRTLQHRASVWRADDGSHHFDPEGDFSHIYPNVFSPDGAWLLSNMPDRGTIKVYRLDDGVEVAELRGHTAEIFCSKFRGDGAFLATGSKDTTIRVWNTTTWETVAALPGHEQQVLSLDFSPSGDQLVSASHTGKVRFWEWRRQRQTRLTQRIPGVAVAVAFISEDRLWVRTKANGSDVQVGIYDLASDTFYARVDQPRDIGQYPAPGLGVVGLEGPASLVVPFDDSAMRPPKRLDGHVAAITAIDVDQAGSRVLSASEDGTAKLWNLEAPREADPFPENASFRLGPNDVVIEPKGGRAIRIHVPNGVPYSKAWKPESSVGAVIALSGRLAVVLAPDPNALLWDVATQECVGLLKGHQGYVTAAAFSEDGRLIATGAHDGTVRLWDGETFAPRGVSEGHGGAVRVIAFGHGGAVVASGGDDHAVRLWDCATGRMTHHFMGHTGAVQSLAFAPGNTRLVSTARDASVAFWDCESGQALRIAREPAPSSAVIVSEDGARVFTASTAGAHCTVWDATTGRELLALDRLPHAPGALALDGARMLRTTGLGGGGLFRAAPWTMGELPPAEGGWKARYAAYKRSRVPMTPSPKRPQPVEVELVARDRFAPVLASLHATSMPETLSTPEAWRKRPVDGHYYALSPPGSWTELQRLAQALGGRLAEFETADEFRWALGAFPNAPRWVFIGLSDAASDFDFRWHSGAPLAFSHLSTTVVPRPDSDRMYVAMDMENDGVWVDLNRNWRAVGLLEAPAVPTWSALDTQAPWRLAHYPMNPRDTDAAAPHAHTLDEAHDALTAWPADHAIAARTTNLDGNENVILSPGVITTSHEVVLSRKDLDAVIEGYGDALDTLLEVLLVTNRVLSPIENDTGEWEGLYVRGSGTGTPPETPGFDQLVTIVRHRIGLASGDVITAINGTALRDRATLLRTLEDFFDRYRTGDAPTLQLAITRGQYEHVTHTLATAPHDSQ